MGNTYPRVRSVLWPEEQPWIGSSVDPHMTLPEIYQTNIAILSRQFETLNLRIAEAEKTFVRTASFKQVQRKLDLFGHVTICGASGEGKTTMGLMLARDYVQKGYEAVFVENVDAFDFHECFSSARRLFLIVDDIFDTVVLKADVLQLRNLLNSIRTQTADYKQESAKPYSAYVGDQNSQSQMLEDRKQSSERLKNKDIRVVFTSKTYNLRGGISKLHYEKMSMFTGQTVVDLTTNSDYFYTDEEKLAIFEQYKILHKAGSVNMSKEDLCKPDTLSFGFPLSCRLFFEFTAFRGSGKDFFSRPVFYLRIEFNNLLSQNNNQTAALILMLLCEDKLHLCNLECEGRDQELDNMFEHVTDIVPSATRQGVATAVRHLRGTFFSGGDVCRFAHSSIYAACACAMFESNPSFVLNNCSLDFLQERLKPGTVEETKVTDRLNFLFVSECYYELIATRLVSAMKQGHFSKTVTQPMLKNEKFVQLILKKLQADLRDTNWIRKTDKGKSFLYWAVQMPSSLLVDLENILCIRFAQSEVNEGLEGSVEADNIANLKMFFPRLEQNKHSTTASKLLLLNAGSVSWEIAEYLLEEGADISTTDTEKRNFVHHICQSGKSNILKSLSGKVDSLIIKKHYLEALNSVDLRGRTPTMLAAVCGSWECFQVVKGSSLDARDIYNNNILHLACQGGNTDIVQHVLTSSDINKRGMYGWTPVIVAAAAGHLDVFDLLVSHEADLSLLSNGGNSILHLACQGGNPDIVQRLLTPANMNSRGMYGTTPVMYAAILGQRRVFDLLVSNSADLTLVDDTGDSVLHLACRGGNKDIVKRLMTPANINCRGKDGRTPIMMSSVYGHLSIFELLALHDADLTLVDTHGNSLLHLACLGCCRDIVQRAMTPSNINTRGRYGWTPIMIATVTGQQSLFELLASNNADLTLVPDSGYSLLHLACQVGNKDVVQHVLTPSNINKTGKHGWTPAMRAAVNGQQNVFELLASNNADLSLVDDYGNSLLHLACQGGNRDIVQHILTPSNINKRGRHGLTPVMKAAVSAQENVFELLASNNADLTLVDDCGNSFLHLACRGGNRNIVQHVLSPFNINKRGQHGWTPIMNAAVSGTQSVFELLVSHNADLTLVDDCGNSLLHLACQGGNRNIVQHVLKPSNINKRGQHGLTPIMRTAVSGQQIMFELLATNNADLRLVDDYGDSLIHLACRGDNRDILQHILTPSNVNTRGEHGWTPLMKAAVNGQQSMFELLVSHNADFTLVDDYGNSLLHLACQGGNRDVVQHVLTPSKVNKRGEHGWTPIMKAAASGQQSMFELLVSSNADLTLADDYGNSLLHLACQGGNRDIVQYVLTTSDINKRGEYGLTPVMRAAVSGQQCVFELLASNKADLTQMNDDGNSLLHLACRGGNRVIVQHVLSASNINKRGMCGRTPVMFAAYYGHRSIIDLFIAGMADLTIVDDNGCDVIDHAIAGGKSGEADYLIKLIQGRS